MRAGSLRPVRTRWAMRAQITRVFPDPGPAMTRIGPSGAVTAGGEHRAQPLPYSWAISLAALRPVKVSAVPLAMRAGSLRPVRTRWAMRADAVFADAKAFSEARQIESELERELHRRRQDLVRKLLHIATNAARKRLLVRPRTPAVSSARSRASTKATPKRPPARCRLWVWAPGAVTTLHRLDAALNLLPERYLVEMRRRVTIATASRAPPRTPWKPLRAGVR